MMNARVASGTEFFSIPVSHECESLVMGGTVNQIATPKEELSAVTRPPRPGIAADVGIDASPAQSPRGKDCGCRAGGAREPVTGGWLLLAAASAGLLGRRKASHEQGLPAAWKVDSSEGGAIVVVEPGTAFVLVLNMEECFYFFSGHCSISIYRRAAGIADVIDDLRIEVHPFWK